MKKIYGLCLTLALAACQALPPSVSGPQTLAGISQAHSAPVLMPGKKNSPALSGTVEIHVAGRQGTTVQMRIQVPRALFQGFRTQDSESHFANFAYLRFSLKAPPLVDPIYPLNALRDPEHPEQDYLIENTGQPLNIVFENIPAGELRFASITAFDSHKQPIPGSTIEAVFPVGLDSTPVSREVTFRTTPLAQILSLLLQASLDLAKGLDLAGLQAFLDQITGLQGTRPNYLYTLQHPLQLDVALLVADLLAFNGNLGLLDPHKNYALPLGQLVGHVQGLAEGDHLVIQTSDLSQPILEVTANGVFRLDGLRSGLWDLSYWVEGGAEYNTPPDRQVVVSGGHDLDLGLIPVLAEKPVIDSLSRFSVPAGESFRIYGSGFHETLAGNRVWIGEQQAEILNASDEELEVRVPDGPVGEQVIRLEIGSSSESYTGFTRTGLDAVTPNRGRIGDWITLTGLALDNIFRVKVNQTEASFQQISETELLVQIPAGASSGKITLLYGEGGQMTSPENFEVTNKVLFVAQHLMSVAGFGEGEEAWIGVSPSLQAALANADSGDEIWVAEGIYTPDQAEGDRHLSFQLKNNVGVYGGFAGHERNRLDREIRNNPTVLSGDLNENDQAEGTSREDNSYHVVTASGVSATTVLDGFILQAGQAETGGLILQGGGLLCQNASPSLRNLVIRDNHADRSGGGMAILGSGSPQLENMVFENNQAANSDQQEATGGGLQIETASDSTPVLKNVVFVNNFALSDGGALFVAGAQPRLTQGSFVGNGTENSDGGNAIGIQQNGSRLELHNSLFWHNPGRDISVAGGQLQLAYNGLEEGLAGVLTHPVTGASFQDLGGNRTLSQTPFADLYQPRGNDQRWMTADDGLIPPLESDVADAGNGALAPSFDIVGRARPFGAGFSMGAYEEAELPYSSGCYPYGC